MNTTHTPSWAPLQSRCRKRIAVITMGVKLGDEKQGYTRFRFLSELLVKQGFDVDLITSSFQHWEKTPRDCNRPCYHNLPYKVVFIQEPGYSKNLDLARILSHRIAAKNLHSYFEKTRGTYDLLYAEIPPNDVARVCAESATAMGIPFVADINDLWPEAMRMVLKLPVLSNLVLYPFARDARIVYRLLSAAVGTSDEYAARPAADRDTFYPRETVYVGNDLAVFDEGALRMAPHIIKPSDELWATYAGTLGVSYDLETLIQAAANLQDTPAKQTPSTSAKPDLKPQPYLTNVQDFTCSQPFTDSQNNSSPQNYAGSQSRPYIRIKILGDGPDRARLENLAMRLGAPVDFLGYQDYDSMAAYLCASDIVINSLVASAAQSIVTKIGDYLASGKPLINTGSSAEFRAKVTSDGFGVNVAAHDAQALAQAITMLANNPSLRVCMGRRGRHQAEQEFDQPKSYLKIINLVRTLL